MEPRIEQLRIGSLAAPIQILGLSTLPPYPQSFGLHELQHPRPSEVGYAARFLTPSRERITAFLYRPLGEKAPPERDCIAPSSRRLCVLHIVTLDASIAIILMYIKSEVADLISFKKRVESILLLAMYIYTKRTSSFLATSKTYPN